MSTESSALVPAVHAASPSGLSIATRCRTILLNKLVGIGLSLARTVAFTSSSQAGRVIHQIDDGHAVTEQAG